MHLHFSPLHALVHNLLLRSFECLLQLRGPREGGLAEEEVFEGLHHRAGGERVRYLSHCSEPASDVCEVGWCWEIEDGVHKIVCGSHSLVTNRKAQELHCFLYKLKFLGVLHNTILGTSVHELTSPEE